MNIT
jgi:hypothetical protein